MGLEVSYREALGIQKPLFIAFQDLEKAFDGVPRVKLWMGMAEYVVLAEYRKCAQASQTSDTRGHS